MVYVKTKLIDFKFSFQRSLSHKSDNQYIPESAQKIAALKRRKLKKFLISQIPENFDIETFCHFLTVILK